MRGAQVYGKGVYVEEGRHVLEIDRLFFKRTSFGRELSKASVHLRVQKGDRELEPYSRNRVDALVRRGPDEPRDGSDGSRRFFSPPPVATPSQKHSPEDEEAIGNIIVALKWEEERARLGWPENFIEGPRRGRPISGGMKGTSKKGGPVWKQESGC